MARTCRVIGGTTIDAFMQWRRLGKLAVRVGLWCVECGPSKNSSGLVASTVDKDLCRIIPAPYHPRIEPFQSLEKDISVKWLTQ